MTPICFLPDDRLVLTPLELDDSIRKAFFDARAHHGELGLPLESYSKRVRSIAQSLAERGTFVRTASGLVGSLYTGDLYLSCACAAGTDLAWRRLLKLYGGLIDWTALRICGSVDKARDLAADIFCDLSLLSRTGERRIGSYNGSCPLGVWLRTVVRNHAANRRRGEPDGMEALETVPEGRLARAGQAEAGYRTARYRVPLRRAIEEACVRLRPQDRLLLVKRYERQLRVSEIAASEGVNPSTITRRISKVKAELRAGIVDVLKSGLGLSDDAVEECLEELREGPAHSVLEVLCGNAHVV